MPNDLFYNCDVDSYKLSHYAQYPAQVTNISSYLVPREGPDEIVFVGPQMWMDKTLDGVVSRCDIDELKSYAIPHGLPFNEDMYGLVGKKLPLRIQSLPEGTIVRPGTPLMQVMNTGGRKTAWLTSFIETSLLRAIWYPTTVATKSREIKKIIKSHMARTCDTLDGLPFKLHDFGFRGVSSYESGCIGGLAHLVNFMGTDTMGALKYAKLYYGEEMAGFSIPAAEHSTMTSWGRERESQAYENMINQFGAGLVAVVSDSYDIYNAADQIWGVELKEKVQALGGTLVIRPDSGDPQVVVPKLLEILGDRFGFTTNSKGYRVLPNYLRVIQGDGVSGRMINNLLGKLEVMGWSAENLAFGMGGLLLQDPQRDDFSFAMKASAKSEDNGRTWIGFAKDPVTMQSKKSEPGRFAVNVDENGIPRGCPEELADETNILTDTWVDGEFKKRTNLATIRKLAEVV